MMETGEKVPAGRLDVSLATFVKELQRANGIVTRRSTGDAILAFDGCELSVRFGGAEFSVPAWGYWSHAVRTSSRWLVAFGKVPPKQDPLRIEIVAGRLRIATLSVPCRAQSLEALTVELPVDVDLCTVLRIGHMHSEGELEGSGVLTAITRARAERDRRMQRAFEHLAPLGVTPAAIEVLVTSALFGDLPMRSKE